MKCCSLGVVALSEIREGPVLYIYINSEMCVSGDWLKKKKKNMTWKKGVYVLEGDHQLSPVLKGLHRRLHDVYPLSDWS